MAGETTVAHTIGQAIRFHEQGHLIEAERIYRELLRASPRHFEALHRLGALKAQQGELGEAQRLLEKAIEIDATSVSCHLNYALLLADLGRHEAVVAACDRALAASPRHPTALTRRADALVDLGRNGQALADYDAAIAADPTLVPALVNRGVLLRQMGRLEEALASHDRALSVDRNDVEAWNNRGVVLHDLGRSSEALASYERALALAPDHVEAWFNCGNALLALRRPADALARFSRALALRPEFADACNNRGTALSQLGDPAQALANYERALALKPDHTDALVNRAHALEQLGRYEEAIAEYERLHRTRPELPSALDDLVRCRLTACQWSGLPALGRKLAADGPSLADPFTLLALDSTPAEQLACAKRWLGERKAIAREWVRERLSGENIRIAYASADFHNHVTANVIAELLERHDRNRFEVIGISFGPDDGSAMRSRLIKAFDRFFEVSTRADADAAKLMRDLGIHIAIDLKGHTKDARVGIMAQRAAPIQVSHIGYPATLGGDFVDYVIADRIVLPPDQHPFFSEKVVYLPDCYHVRDCTQHPAPTRPARSSLRLPDGSFVFCCFNNSWKINASIFDIWMRLLAAVPGSVLWLFSANDLAVSNLRKEAAARGVDPVRLVFAPRCELADHLARLTYADLFLDTLPYNAHTTASDALWAGVPLITCTGSTFPGRVATSLLHAVGMPELVTTSLEQYEVLGRKLATEPSLLQSMRDKLAQNRSTSPLFDTARYARHLEAAYETMWEIWRRGEQPRAFSVEPRAQMDRVADVGRDAAP